MEAATDSSPGAAAGVSDAGPSPSQPGAVRVDEVDEARGAVVLAHGLNTTPQVMADVAAVLHREGYRCAHVDLRAPGPPGRDPDAVLARWVRAYDLAHEAVRAGHEHLQVSAVGFSLGAVLALLRAGSAHAPLQRLVMWAPPLALGRSAARVRLLAPAHRMGLSLPSATPRRVRARQATPLVEYAALLRLLGALDHLDPAALALTPTLVLVSPDDPLVDADGVRHWVACRGLDGWTTEVVRDRPRVPLGHRHLLVDARSMGPTAWQRATARMLAHLSDADDP